MAKLGEGDKRWIVAERDDGTNCNSWHWEEKDLSAVTHDTLKGKFKNLVLNDDGGLKVTVKEISDISGDVTVAQRKGKIMCYFDVKLTLKYKASLAGEAEVGEGKVVAPEIDHDGFRDTFELNVSAMDSKPASVKAEQWMRGEGRKKVREEIRHYFEGVFQQHNVGKFLKNGSPASPPPKTASSSATPAATAPSAAPAAKAAVPVATSNKTTLTWKMEWRCPVEELWQVLVDSGRASHYTRAPAKIDAQPSGTFEFLGGLISGYFTDVVANQKLVMQWRLSSWPSGVFTSVIINLSREEAGVSRLEFAQAGIPDGEYQRVHDGWMRSFWEPIKAVFGFNYTVL